MHYCAHVRVCVRVCVCVCDSIVALSDIICRSAADWNRFIVLRDGEAKRVIEHI